MAGVQGDGVGGGDLTARVITARVREQLFGGAEPVRIGRFTLRARIGAGAMGAIFSARDETLDRELAIKVVHAHRACSAHARERMLKEARAMARVSHPNVVAIYEAGEHEGQVFIAMEFVEGTTLSTWCAAKRTWREVVAMFVAIGHGLEAAHAAGVVHRDFKPDNVLVTRDGVPKVADFGLAQLLYLGEELDTEDGTSASPSTTRLGTPRYRPPEQPPADARGDQFSFCVALHEALFGVHPSSTSPVARMPSRVPTWVRAAVLRGLAIDPAQRHASMKALVEALARDPSSQRRRLLALGAGVIVLSAGTMGAVSLGPPPPCEQGEDALGTAWRDERRATVLQHLEEMPVAYAADTSERVAHSLDAYRDGWLAAYREACEATRVHGHQSEALLDRRMVCLDARRRALGVAVDTLADLDARSMARAIAITHALPSIAECEGIDALPMPLPDDPELRRRVISLEDLDVRAAAALTAGHHADAERLADDAVEEAERLLEEHPELARQHALALADALYTRGRARMEIEDIEDALVWLRRSYHTADEAGDDTRRTRAAIAIVFAASHSDPPADDAEQWIEHAWSALRRGGGNASFEGALRGTIGSWHARGGRFEEAVAEQTRALSLVSATEGPTRPLDVAAAHNERAYALVQLGRLDEALADYRQSARILGEAMGPAHPRTGLARDNLGNLLRELGRPAESRAEHEAALAIIVDAFGEAHPNAARSRGNLGAALRALGRHAEALPLHERTLDELLRALGPTHPDLATAQRDVAEDLAALGRHADALPHFEAAARAFERTQGRDGKAATEARAAAESTRALLAASR